MASDRRRDEQSPPVEPPPAAIVHFGLIKPSIDSGKTMDMKIGEDGVMYSVVNSLPDGSFYKGNISLYKSTDKGANWIHIFGYLYTSYVGSVSMLPLRIQNLSTLARCALHQEQQSPHRRKQWSHAPPAGKVFHISALSDGACYAPPTLPG